MDRNNKQTKFKDCVPFSDCISEISNIKVGNARDLDVIMPISILIEYSDNYSKILWNLNQFCRDEPKYPMTYSGSFKFK